MLMLPILLYILGMLPAQSEPDLLFRTQLAHAISEGTSDVREQIILARLAWFEGGYRRSVASCKIKGDGGKSQGIFQIQPRDAQDKRDACGTLNAQVAVALRFIRRSREVCGHLEPQDQLSLYTTGACYRVQPEARRRWGADEASF